MSLRAACALVAAIAFAAAAAGIGVRGSRAAQTTGDEPHYLTTAISLGEDGDLDVRDELEQRRYAPFHAPTLSPQERVLADGRMVSPHDPLLPALLAAPVAIGGWVAAKLALALLAAAQAGLLLWVAVARLRVPLRPAALAVSVFAASSPLAVYGSLVYPELAAALLVTATVAGIATPLAVVALPWLSVKYAAVAAVLALPGLRRRPSLLLGYAAAAAAFLLAHRVLYDGWTPYAAGDHFAGGELTVVGSDPDYVGRSRRLLGLLVDRTFGLVAWQPAWLLAVPALAALAAGRPPWWKRVALPLAAGWLVATFVALTMHGWWWPGRQVVVVLPVAVLAVAWWAARSRRNEVLLLGLGAAGFLTYAWFLVEAYATGLTWVVDFFETSNPLYRAWRLVLPDFWHPRGSTWPLAAAWLVLLAAVAAYEYTGTRRAWGRSATRAPSGTTSVDGRWETSTLPSTTTR